MTTVADIKARFPSLYAQAKKIKDFNVDAFINIIIIEITPFIDYEFWGDYSSIITKLTVAHNLDLELMKFKRNGNVGLEQSRTVVGQYSVSYAAPMLGKVSDQYQTQYSIQIDELRTSLTPHFITQPLTFDRSEINIINY